jgi:hypothetical protein
MTFFVSDILKDRITEKQILEDDNIESNDLDNSIYAEIEIKKKHLHKFYLNRFCKDSSKITLEIDIPQTYKFLTNIITSEINITIRNNFDIVFKTTTDNFSFELIKQNERNSYLLIIVIVI